jgi:hypothetical protein
MLRLASRSLTLVALLVTFAVMAGPAHAATTLGQTIAPSGCGTSTVLITGAAANYAAPAAGVLTSFSVQGGAANDQVQLTVLRHTTGTQYTVVAESAPVAIPTGTLVTSARPTRRSSTEAVTRTSA